MEIRVKVSSSQTEPISSFFMDFLSRFLFFYYYFLRRGREGRWVLLLHCKQKGKATLMLLFYVSCGQSVFVLPYRQETFLTHNDSYSVSHLTSEASAEERAPPWSEPPRSALNSAARPGWCRFQNCRSMH